MTEALSMRLTVVITTIQSPTVAVLALSERLRELGANLVIAGDKKGPSSYGLDDTRFLSLQDQLDGPFELARKLPIGHYARKNVAYLEAIASGAACIYETDDDNAPMPGWAPRSERVPALAVEETGWINAYQSFTSERIWPRGMPLDAIAESLSRKPAVANSVAEVRAPIQQGLANGSPDVDAIWRLVLDRPFEFDVAPSVQLPAGAWCPFNSQSTWWWPDAYPLLYLPSFCSFRMTDIWRSFVAQRCIWELGLGVVFHGAEVVQDRNEHDLMRDFNDEIPGYQRNRELAKVLEDTTLVPGADAVGENLLRCYRVLVARGFFVNEELNLVDAWLSGMEQASSGS